MKFTFLARFHLLKPFAPKECHMALTPTVGPVCSKSDKAHRLYRALVRLLRRHGVEVVDGSTWDAEHGYGEIRLEVFDKNECVWQES